MVIYKKIFLVFFIAMSLVMTILISFDSNIGTALLLGIGYGLTSGICVSWILGSLHFYVARKIHGGNRESAMSVYQIRNIELQIPIAETFELCVKSISCFNNSYIVKANREAGIIELKTGFNFWTGGDLISFYLTSFFNNCTSVEISSRPISLFRIIDYGKNIKNAEVIVSYLKEQAPIAEKR